MHMPRYLGARAGAEPAAALAFGLGLANDACAAAAVRAFNVNFGSCTGSTAAGSMRNCNTWIDIASARSCVNVHVPEEFEFER